MTEKGSKGSKSASGETTVEVTVSGARGVKNTKVFGKMSPCFVVAIPGTSIRQVSNPSANGGANPSWNQTVVFQVPDSVLESTSPSPSATVEIFDSSDLKTSLGMTTIPLAVAIAHYDEPQYSTLGVIRKSKVQGYLTFAVKCGRTSFAPAKGSSEYDAFVKRLAPGVAPPPVASSAPHGTPHSISAPARFTAAPPAAAGAAAGAAGAAAGAAFAAGSGPHPSHGYPAQPYPHQYSQPAPHAPYPPPGGYPPPSYGAPGYHQPAPYPYPPPGGYPPPYGGYPPQYGAYPPQQTVVYQQRSSGMGGGMGGMGMGLMAGAAGGLLLGAALGDIGDGDCGDMGF